MGFENPIRSEERFGKAKGGEQEWRAEILKKREEGEADLPAGKKEEQSEIKPAEVRYDKFTRDRGGRLEDILPRE